ncbi:unnamed protein product [Cylicocyclus nassatus]|uniref:Uncharacterized protein n=1 Tax=Cylicocyclus nassatus TaxID=53992 RepID=A0AA36HHZ8_CYLNA|nr:unnamed protein product [Cylicocyclus nassatus]
MYFVVKRVFYLVLVHAAILCVWNAGYGYKFCRIIANVRFAGQKWGRNDGERLEFPTSVALRHHMASVHQLTYCHICIENIIQFSRERKTHTRDGLQRHIRARDRDDKSLRGHPSCLFCEQRFFDEEFRFPAYGANRPQLFQSLVRTNLLSFRVKNQLLQKAYTPLNEDFPSLDPSLPGSRSNPALTTLRVENLPRLNRVSHSGCKTKVQNKLTRMVLSPVDRGNNHMLLVDGVYLGQTTSGKSIGCNDIHNSEVWCGSPCMSRSLHFSQQSTSLQLRQEGFSSHV